MSHEEIVRRNAFRMMLAKNPNMEKLLREEAQVCVAQLYNFGVPNFF